VVDEPRRRADEGAARLRAAAGHVRALGLVVVVGHGGIVAALGAVDLGRGRADDVFQQEAAAVPTRVGALVAPVLVGELAMAGTARQVSGNALHKLDLLKRMQRTSDEFDGF